MRRALLASLISCGLLAALPALADDGVRLGETYRGVVQLKTYGSPQVPLPPGDWKLVALGDSIGGTSNIRLLTGHFIQVAGKDGKVMAGRASFIVSDSPVRGTFTQPSLCSRTDYIANFSKPIGAQGYDCAWVTAYGLLRPNRSTDELNQFYDYVEQNKIKKPGSVVGVSFNISDGRSYYSLDYAFNPDLEKIAPASTTLWHRDRYKEDPKREAFAERLKTWSQAMRGNVAEAYKGRLPASFPPVQVFPTAANPAVAKTPVNPLAQVASLGGTYRDAMPLNILGAPQIPLPPGDWKLVVLDQIQNEQQKIRLIRGYLIQTRGDVLAGHIFFAAPDGASSSPWNPPASCSQKSPLADLSRDKGSAKGFDCASITAYSGTRPQKATDQLAKYHDYLEANGIKSPPTMLNIAFGVSDAATYVMAEYRFNPANDGVRAESIAAWRPERISEDSKRAAYIEKMKAWAHTWHAKVEAGYKSALPKTAKLN